MGQCMCPGAWRLFTQKRVSACCSCPCCAASPSVRLRLSKPFEALRSDFDSESRCAGAHAMHVVPLVASRGGDRISVPESKCGASAHVGLREDRRGPDTHRLRWETLGGLDLVAFFTAPPQKCAPPSFPPHRTRYSAHNAQPWGPAGEIWRHECGAWACGMGVWLGRGARAGPSASKLGRAATGPVRDPHLLPRCPARPSCRITSWQLFFLGTEAYYPGWLYSINFPLWTHYVWVGIIWIKLFIFSLSHPISSPLCEPCTCASVQSVPPAIS